MSIINVNEIGPVSLGSTVTLTAGSTLKLPTNTKIDGDIGSLVVPGTIIQVKNVIKQDTFVTTSTSYSVVTGLSIAITPLFSSSKILIMPSVNGNAQNRGGTIEIRRNGSRVTGLMPTNNGNRGPTNIGGLWTGDGSGDGGMLFGRTITLYDSPNTTSEVTYAVYARTLDPNAYGTRINYANDDSNEDDFIRGVSTITVMEVKV